MTRRVFITLATFILLASSGLAGDRGLKVLLLYDMEGVSGATDAKHTDSVYSKEYEHGRRSLTADVNAAVAGLKAAGATEIVVVDGHGSGNDESPDVLVEELLPPASMHYRSTPFDIYMESYDHSFDAIVAVAMHAAAGNRTGFLSHTYTLEDVEYTVNGVPFNESMILAMGAARFKTPLIMVSGDDQLEREVQRRLPWAKYASVKHAVDRSKADALPREEASRRIEEAARAALENLNAAQCPEFPGSYRFALTFQDEQQARSAALVPGSEVLPGGRTVQIRAQDFEEGYRLSLRLIRLASWIGRLAAIEAVVEREPNAAELRLRVNDWLIDRWLDRLPPEALPPHPGGATARYWGAR